MRIGIFSILCGMVLLPLSLYLSGCNIINKKEEIPAYLVIDSVVIEPSSGQGNAIHDIGIIQVYVGNEFLGNFELPARIPVLQIGNKKVNILAGVRENGSSNSFRNYNVIAETDTTLNFVSSQITYLRTLKFKYRDNIAFRWMEDFEDNNSSLIKYDYPQGDTFGIETVPYDMRGKFLGNTKALVLNLSAADTVQYFEFKSFQKFGSLPLDGTNVYFEFDMLTPIEVQVGLIRYNGSSSEAIPYLIINNTGGNWRRFYLNLNYELGGQPAGTQVELFIAANKFTDAGAAKIYIDNIKLLHLN